MANLLALAGPNSRWQQAERRPAGFFAGLWHGFTAPLVFWLSLVFSGVRVYETRNKGRRYDFGFLLAIGAWATQSRGWPRPPQ